MTVAGSKTSVPVFEYNKWHCLPWHLFWGGGSDDVRGASETARLSLEQELRLHDCQNVGWQLEEIVQQRVRRWLHLSNGHQSANTQLISLMMSIRRIRVQMASECMRHRSGVVLCVP